MDVKDLTLAHVKSHLQVQLKKHSFYSHLHVHHRKPKENPPIQGLSLSLSFSIHGAQGPMNAVNE
jgi:hypothetical protein